MRRIIPILALLMLGTIAGQAADKPDGCNGPGKDGGMGLIQYLEKLPTCAAAIKTFHGCAWGSSADTEFSAIVVQKCEAAFKGKLKPDQFRDYAGKMQQCAYRYAQRQGTMFMAAAALCQADVAAAYAANPAGEAKQPLPKASFDCAEAAAPLERAICADIGLGHADVLLAEIYRKALKRSKPHERSKLVSGQKQWLVDTVKKCRPAIPAGQKEIDCLTGAFATRFNRLDECSEFREDMPECLHENTDGNADQQETPPSSPRRASFDCEKPNTALEIAICADAALGQADIRLDATYREILAAMPGDSRKDVITSQRAWLHSVPRVCTLGAVGGIPSVFGRACAVSVFEARTAQLRTCTAKPDTERLPCLNVFRVLPEDGKAKTAP